jgi:hypothetical protein
LNTVVVIDDLLARSQPRPRTRAQNKLLRMFREHASAYPELIQQLRSAVEARLGTNNSAASFREACEHVRWDTRTHIPNVLVPWYARATVFHYPHLNGTIEFGVSVADGVLGTWIAPGKLPGDYARRLQWGDGIDAPQSGPPTQGELFDKLSA